MSRLGSSKFGQAAHFRQAQPDRSRPEKPYEHGKCLENKGLWSEVVASLRKPDMRERLTLDNKDAVAHRW